MIGDQNGSGDTTQEETPAADGGLRYGEGGEKKNLDKLTMLLPKLEREFDRLRQAMQGE